jgi:hypothetical protein
MTMLGFGCSHYSVLLRIPGRSILLVGVLLALTLLALLSLLLTLLIWT